IHSELVKRERWKRGQTLIAWLHGLFGVDFDDHLTSTSSQSVQNKSEIFTIQNQRHIVIQLETLDWTGFVELEHYIGSGAFGDVYRAKWINLGASSAVESYVPHLVMKKFRATP